MPVTPNTITVRVLEDLDERALLDALLAAAAIAGVAEALVQRTATANPIVIARQELAPLQAALDSWAEASSKVVAIEEGEPSEPSTVLAESLADRGETGDDVLEPLGDTDDDDPVGELERPFDRPPADEDSPTEQRARALRRSLEGGA